MCDIGSCRAPLHLMIEDQTQNYSDRAQATSGHVMLVNIFTPKPGQVDSFIAAQTAEYKRLEVDGWIGNRLGRAVDGTKLVNIAVFESLAKYNAWRESDQFVEHLEVIKPFVEQAAPGMYEIIYSAGRIP